MSFDETECPEVIITKPIDKHLCGEHCGVVVLTPEPPLTLCDFKPTYPGCTEGPEGKPDCESNPKLCMPPRYCDLEPFMPECLEGVDEEEEEKCRKGDNTKRCRWATKCDNEEFKDVPNCEMINPC